MSSIPIASAGIRKSAGTTVWRTVGSWIRTVALAGMCAYVAACGILWKVQAHLIFEPDANLHSSPQDYRFAIEDVAIPMPGARDSNEVLHGWWVPSAASGAKTVLYLHGNDGNVSTNMGRIEGLRELGYTVFLIDYRGYGRSRGGFPDEAGVYQDAQAAWDYVVHARGTAPSDVLIYGYSLGGAVAIELATHHPEALGLVVESSFTSIQDIAGLNLRYSILPVSQMLEQRFESIRKVRNLTLPVLYVHGTADELVPYDMGRTLFAATPSAVGFVTVPGAGHDNNAAIGGVMLTGAIDTFVKNHSAAAAQVTASSATSAQAHASPFGGARSRVDSRRSAGL